MKKHIFRTLKTFFCIISLFTMTVFGSSEGLTVDGVDVSTYQSSSTDWVKVKEDGMDFAIIRLTVTFANSGRMATDKNFTEHFENAGDAGLLRGVYVFSQAVNAEEGRKEAEFAIETLKDSGITPDDLDLPVYMDYEFHHKSESRMSDLTREDAVKAANSFCEVIRENGYKTGVYANTTFFAQYLDNGTHLPEGTDIWVAQYNSYNSSGSDYSIWQYSSSGRVDGISGRVDVNRWYLDTEDDSDLTVTAENDVEYTGSPVYPEVTIKDRDRELTEGVDYEIKGIRNIDGDDAYAYIKGIGDYEGCALVKLNIGSDFAGLNLPPSVLEADPGIRISQPEKTIIHIPEDMTVSELLEKVRPAGEEFTAGVTDSHGNLLSGTDTVTFDCMLGIFNEDSLIGTIDIETEDEILNSLRSIN